MLSIAAIKAARPKPRPYKIFDGGGLYLHVLVSGSKTWRWKYRVAGAERVLTIGDSLDVSLVDARARAAAAREQLARGEDPQLGLVAGTGIRAFEYAFRAWYRHRRPSWTPVHAGDILLSIERDVLPAIGDQPLDEIRKPAIIRMLRAIERRGSVETARRVQQRVAKIFAFACAEGWCEANPAAEVIESLGRAAAVRRQPALVDVDELRELLAAADRVGAGASIVLASRFLSLTAVRLAAVRGARWSEIEDVDGAEPLWRVPAARMKLAAAKKGDAAHDHLVPLSAAAVAVLRAARANMHSEDASMHGAALIFPGAGGASIGEGAISALYARAGYAGRHVPHGWRASFSTVMNLRRPNDRGAIDRALGHVGGGRDEAEQGINVQIERAYNRGIDLRLRRAIMAAWAECLTACEQSGSTADFLHENRICLVHRVVES